MTQIYLPNKPRDKPLYSIVSHYNATLRQLYIAENEQEGGYRLTVWDFENEQLELVFASEVKSPEHCIALKHFEHPSTSLLAVIE